MGQRLARAGKQDARARVAQHRRSPSGRGLRHAVPFFIQARLAKIWREREGRGTEGGREGEDGQAGGERGAALTGRRAGGRQRAIGAAAALTAIRELPHLLASDVPAVVHLVFFLGSALALGLAFLESSVLAFLPRQQQPQQQQKQKMLIAVLSTKRAIFNNTYTTVHTYAANRKRSTAPAPIEPFSAGTRASSFATATAAPSSAFVRATATYSRIWAFTCSATTWASSMPFVTWGGKAFIATATCLSTTALSSFTWGASWSLARAASTPAFWYAVLQASSRMPYVS
mmetsp:Transcript_49213/g.140508  ORF Transcript_49213/g.140508 Transcript_49213/m.140508 type:complete len:287 (-) Transcript_49213:164-1024(-)